MCLERIESPILVYSGFACVTVHFICFPDFTVNAMAKRRL